MHNNPTKLQVNTLDAASSSNKNSSAYLSSWILDSGASRICCYDVGQFINYSKYAHHDGVKVASGQILEIVAVGRIDLPLPNEGVMVLQNVWHVPELKENVLSIFCLTALGYAIVFFSDKARIYGIDGQILFTIRARNGIYSLFTGHCIDMVLSIRMTDKTSKAMLWHLRLGHLNIDHLRIILRRMGIKCPGELQSITCLKAKITSKPFGKGKEPAEDVLELIHSDICGPLGKRSGSAKYFVTFIDDYTRMVFVYGLAAKSDVYDAFKQFRNLVENQTGKKINNKK